MLTRALFVSAVLVAASGFIAHASRSEEVPVRASFATFPTVLGEWRGRPLPPLEDEVLAILGVDDYLTRAYFTDRRSAVGLYVGYWQSQRQGDAIHSPLNCLPGAGWTPVSKRDLQLQVHDPTMPTATREITINRYVIEKGLERQLVLYWYQSHGRVIASEYLGKVYLVADAVRLNRTDAAIVRVIVPIAPGTPDSEARAEKEGVQFVQTLFPTVTEYLPL